MKTAICAIAKNENLYINDWCKWHLNLGFDEIFLFDNNDIETEFVGNFIDDEIKNKVNIIPVNHFKQFQKQAYNDYYKNFGFSFDWSAIIDIDEFIVLNQEKNIKDFLNKFDNDIECIRLNWQIYGDDGILNGNTSIPVYERITKKLNHRYNYHGKCIIRGHLNDVIFSSVHYPLIENRMPRQCLPSGKILLNDAKINLNVIEYTDAYLAHYMTKTWEEFKKQKLNRTDAALERHLKEDYYFIVNPETKKKIYKN